jgi:hypothetical protein
MTRYFKTAFRYSCIYFIATFFQWIYFTFFDRAGTSDITLPRMIIRYGHAIAFYACLLLCHRAYMKGSPGFRFRDILIVSFLFIFFNYCLHFALQYASYHLYFKQLAAATSRRDGLLGLLDTFEHSRPSAPVFAPYRNIIRGPIDNVIFLLRQRMLLALLDYVLLSPLFGVFIAAYHSSLYRIFSLYGHHEWYWVLPVFNKWKLAEVAGRPKWDFLLFLIPFVRVLFLYSINKKLAGDFGKKSGFATGMTFLGLIYYCFLGLRSKERLQHKE